MQTDFKFGGKLASEFGLMIGYIGGAPGEEIIAAGTELNLNQVSVRHGNKFLTTDTTYDSPIEKTFQVFKFSCEDGGLQTLSLDEKRKISRWLLQKEPQILELIGDEEDEDFSRYIFEGTFVGFSEIFYYDECVGLELHFISNRPYAIGKMITRTIVADTTDFEYVFNDVSDEVGHIYPSKLSIIFDEECDFKLINYIENPNGRITEIKNCKAGETITFTDSLIISSSDETHEATLQNDFNFCFFRIANSYNNRSNKLLISHPCTIKIEYNPVVKGVGL